MPEFSANEPFILLADEPTGNLDPEASRGIVELLEKINKSGTAVCMATHNYELIRYAPHRTIVLENGLIRREIDSKNISSIRSL